MGLKQRRTGTYDWRIRICVAFRSCSVVYLRENDDIFGGMKYHGIYRDDRFLIFDGIISKEAINNLLKNIQWRVDRMAESECLQFIIKIWGRDENIDIQHEILTVVGGTHVLYLDMEIHWNVRDKLKFQVRMKSNQKLKYLNKDSTHLSSVFKAIPKGVFNILVKITSKSKKLE